MLITKISVKVYLDFYVEFLTRLSYPVIEIQRPDFCRVSLIALFL